MRKAFLNSDSVHIHKLLYPPGSYGHIAGTNFPKTNMAPRQDAFPKGNSSYRPRISGAMLVLGRVRGALVTDP